MCVCVHARGGNAMGGRQCAVLRAVLCRVLRSGWAQIQIQIRIRIQFEFGLGYRRGSKAGVRMTCA